MIWIQTFESIYLDCNLNWKNHEHPLRNYHSFTKKFWGKEQNGGIIWNLSVIFARSPLVNKRALNAVALKSANLHCILRFFQCYAV
jgi:hypothetical protein